MKMKEMIFWLTCFFNRLERYVWYRGALIYLESGYVEKQRTTLNFILRRKMYFLWYLVGGKIQTKNTYREFLIADCAECGQQLKITRYPSPFRNKNQFTCIPCYKKEVGFA